MVESGVTASWVQLESEAVNLLWVGLLSKNEIKINGRSGFY